MWCPWAVSVSHSHSSEAPSHGGEGQQETNLILQDQPIKTQTDSIKGENNYCVIKKKVVQPQTPIEDSPHQRLTAWTPQRWKVHSSLLLLALVFQKQTLVENHDFTYGADAKQVSENTLVLLPSSHIASGDFYVQGKVKQKGSMQEKFSNSTYLRFNVVSEFQPLDFLALFSYFLLLWGLDRRWKYLPQPEPQQNVNSLQINIV